jgi:hypothetical protein
MPAASVNSKKKKLDPKIIRVGDTVKVINPLIFERCGYPLGLTDGYKILEGYRKELDQFLYSIEVNEASGELEKALAFLLIKNLSFGGPERKVYYTEEPTLKGLTGQVTNRKVVKTGIRSIGFKGPNFLEKEKTVVLFQVLDGGFWHVGHWFAKENLEKIYENPVP